MKKLIFILIAILVCGAALADVKAGTVSKSKGGVDLVKAGAVIGKVARQGTDMFMDDILRTKRSSYAEVKFVDGTLIKVFEKSRLILNGIDRSKSGYNAQVQSGKVLFKVEKMYNVAGDFRIKTTNAVIGVKGTVLGVSADPSGTVVEVFAGRVELTPVTVSGLPAAPVVLTPGRGGVVSQNGTVTTYGFGRGVGPSSLFPSMSGQSQPAAQPATAAPSVAAPAVQTAAQPSAVQAPVEAAAVQPEPITPDSQAFAGLGTGEEERAGTEIPAPFEMPPSILPGASAASIQQSIKGAMNSANSAASGIYNSGDNGKRHGRGHWHDYPYWQ